MAKGYTVKDTVFGQDVEILVYIPVDETEGFIKDVIEVTNARVIAETGDNLYITVDENGKIISE
jgi:uncharacterized protein YuzE